MSNSVMWFLLPVLFVLVVAMIGAGIASWNEDRWIKKRCKECGNKFEVHNKYKKSDATNHTHCEDCQGKYWSY